MSSSFEGTATDRTTGSTRTFYGAPEGHDARLLAIRAREAMRDDAPLIHITLDDRRANTLADLFAFFAPDVEVVTLPAWDCLPYDRTSPSTAVIAKRAAALHHIIAWQAEQVRKPRVLLTSVSAALQRVPGTAVFADAGFAAARGGRLDVTHLTTYLGEHGYARTDTVREAGEFSIRGSIIDIFPPDDPQPVRFDLFGDEIETIRHFDPLTQRSGTPIERFSLTPVSELQLNAHTIARFRTTYRETFGGAYTQDPLYTAISEGRRYNGMEHWLPLFYEELTSVFACAPTARVSFDAHAQASYTERLTQVQDFYSARKTLEGAGTRAKKGKSKDVSLSGASYHPLPPDALYLNENEWKKATGKACVLSPFQPPEEASHTPTYPSALKGRNFADVRALPDGNIFAALKDYIQSSSDKPSVVVAYSAGSLERIKTMMEGEGFSGLKTIAGAQDLKAMKPSDVGLGLLPLEDGFDAPDLRIITEQDVLGDRLSRSSGQKKRKADQFLTEVSSLQPGDYVVHIDHGIGRFLALETVKAGKALHDCLKLEYAGGDKLFVPVENIDLLSRFGSSDATATCDRLGGAGWQARKAKAKKDLMAMADQLLEIAAARQLKKAPSFDVSDDLYTEFSARFPYTETEDQARAIHSTLGDLSRDFPMDRLVCGDVGFGKTEVAIRAAFVAAMNGKQVAIVAPTTLLARQHYKTFTERFLGTGLKISALSRLVKAKDLTTTKTGLASGDVNIVIGTHAVFGASVKFADLGLVIIDEEQRFGVKQKERLKSLKENVHVLTLTATPIPRTLQMGLTGVKEMSLIATPPVDRLAVRTSVLPYDPVVVREALLREHYRGGQSFYVCPRIKDLAAIEDALTALVPDIKVITAHGQMPPQELEDRMNAFYDGHYGILLATNIIESGIDIPRANTMIIHRSDLFGLAQLYQIRGRIGRSKQRAYAYLTYPSDALLAETALKRLEVMETLDTLGAGFQLASHDMDIRGAGNILGEKQSGHIREIGVELYQKMLEDAVALAREAGTTESTHAQDTWSPVINLGTSIRIPEEYIPDLSTRMSLYRRLGDLNHSDDVEALAAEMIDRFGDLPKDVMHLLEVIELKLICRKAGIAQIDAGPKGAVLAFHPSSPPIVESLLEWILSKSGSVKLRPDQKITIIRQYNSEEQRIKSIKRLAQELASL